MVSDLALFGLHTAFRFVVKRGIRPHCSRSRCVPFVSGFSRTTIAACVGAKFQDGGTFSTTFVVRNRT